MSGNSELFKWTEKELKEIDEMINKITDGKNVDRETLLMTALATKLYEETQLKQSLSAVECVSLVPKFGEYPKLRGRNDYVITVSGIQEHICDGVLCQEKVKIRMHYRDDKIPEVHYMMRRTFLRQQLKIQLDLKEIDDLRCDRIQHICEDDYDCHLVVYRYFDVLEEVIKDKEENK